MDNPNEILELLSQFSDTKNEGEARILGRILLEESMLAQFRMNKRVWEDAKMFCVEHNVTQREFFELAAGLLMKHPEAVRAIQEHRRNRRKRRALWYSDSVAPTSDRAKRRNLEHALL